MCAAANPKSRKQSTVRTAMMLEYQASDAAENIHRAILDGAARFKTGDGYEIGFPAVVVSARKP